MRVLVIGAITRDLDAADRDGMGRPGGVVTYAGRTFAALGARTHAVTRLRAQDVPALAGPLVGHGVHVVALPSTVTTTYANDYGGPHDHHELLLTSDPILGQDVPPAWRDAEVVHLGPLHPVDIDPSVLGAVRGSCALDVQGLLRTIGGGPARAPAELEPWLRRRQVVQVSEGDLEALAGGRDLEALRADYEIAELLVTRGSHGVDVVTAQGRRRVRGEPVSGGDPTGAGDVLLACYLLARAVGYGSTDAARCACRLAARHIAGASFSPADLVP